MKPLAATELRRLAKVQDLELAPEVMERLLPMVRDLLAVAESVRRKAQAWASDDDE